MNFRDLSQFPPIFVEFMEGTPSARKFLGAPPDIASAVARAADIRQPAGRDVKNNQWMLEQLRQRNSNSLSFENAGRLSNPGTIAILGNITAAVAGGPLCMLLKCLTLCRLAAEMSGHGFQAVPVCWVDPPAPDSVARQSILLLDTEGQLQPLSVVDEKPEMFAGETERLISQVAQIAPGQQSAETLEFLRENYAGPTLSSACSRLLSALTRDWGLVVVDAGQPQSELAAAGKAESLAADSAVAAVTARRKQQMEGAGYASSGNGAGTRRAILPLLQGMLFPVAIQVYDPAELYFRGLMEPVYDMLHLRVPVAWHRISATLVDSRSGRFLRRHGLHLNELFVDRERVFRRIGSETEQVAATKRFEAMVMLIRERFDEFLTLVHPDDNLRQQVESSREKMLYQVGKLKARFLASSQTRREVEQRHFKRACNALAPAGQLQEDAIAMVNFLLRHSLGVVKLLYERLNPSILEHQILPVD